jgi:hypothetical protein
MKSLTYEHRIQLLALAAGLPGSLIAILLLGSAIILRKLPGRLRSSSLFFGSALQFRCGIASFFPYKLFPICLPPCVKKIFPSALAVPAATTPSAKS